MFDLVSLIKTVGYLGLFAIVFAESGLLIGFFLPGDSLLFTAGFLSSQGYLNVWLLMPLLFFAAVLGDNVGYSFGYKVGPRIFKRQDSLLFNQDYLRRANAFFNKHGGAAIILARFIPAVRTFTPILAGVGKMHYRTFLMYNLLGGALWIVSLTLLGHYLGKVIPNVDHYILPIIAVIIVLSVMPTVLHLVRDKESRARIREFIKRRL